MQNQISRSGLPDAMSSPPTSTQNNNDPRWNLIRPLEFPPPTDLRTSTSARLSPEAQNDFGDKMEDFEETVSFGSNRLQPARGSSLLDGTDPCSYSRSGNYLDDLVDCLRSDVEDSLRRRQQALEPCLADHGECPSRSPSSSSSSSSTMSSRSTPNSTCELVSALQNHFKSAAVVVATAAAAAAAAAAVTVPTDSNHHHHELIPLNLKWPGDERIRSDAEEDEDEEVDLISIGNDESGRVQHTEIVQTTTIQNDLTKSAYERPDHGPMAATNQTQFSLTGYQPLPSINSSQPIRLDEAPSNTHSQRQAQSSSPVNSHGHHHTKQRRLYKCRHCPFETDKKVENWQHIRVHMRPEKLLSCNSCLFVTEYKHHLEYHQRNHTGYKPFKCEHCDYTCVNKSMLNSHMKSHSSVYQYQCGDCKYATKYVHSLKMHLRKYSHQPAALMIDIFGRKRGPKPGSGRKQQQQQQQQQQQPTQTGPTTPISVSNGKSKSRKQQAAIQQNCKILDLRMKSKLENQ